METKQVVKKINWLDEVDGMTIAQAISYLQTLPADHKLSYYMEGDTHGCEVVASIYQEVPLTNAEILAKREKHFNKEIALFEKAKQEHVAAGRTSRVESCEAWLVRLRAKLEEVRAKYK